MRKSIEDLVKEKHYLGVYGLMALKECPLLSDKQFTDKYPGISLVAAFIYATRDLAKRYNKGEAIPLFEEIGIKSLNEYLELIPKIMNKGTKEHYLEIKKRLDAF